MPSRYTVGAYTDSDLKDHIAVCVSHQSIPAKWARDKLLAKFGKFPDLPADRAKYLAGVLAAL